MSNLRPDPHTLNPITADENPHLADFVDAHHGELLCELAPEERPWDEHRHHAEKTQWAFIGSQIPSLVRRAHRIRDCSRWLEYGWVHFDEAVKLKLKRTEFCRDRFCVVCQWRRSLNWAARMYQALPEIEANYPTFRWITLTLTIRNCRVEDLRETITHMNRSFRRLTHSVRWPGRGWLKAVEVTRGQDGGRGEDATAHPHIHALVLVPRRYFGPEYVKHAEWVQLWRRFARLNYDPSVRVRPVKVVGDSRDEFRKALAETAKYGLKPSDMTEDPEWVSIAATQLIKTRQIEAGGVLRQHLKRRDPVQRELIAGDDPKHPTKNHGGEFFGWGFNGKPQYGRPKRKPETTRSN